MTKRDQYKKIFQVVANISSAITNMRLYLESHPQVKRYVEDAYAELTKFLLTRKRTTLLLIDDELVLDNQPLGNSVNYFSQFIPILRNHGIESITFVSGVSEHELYELIRDLASSDSDYVASSNHIKLGKLELRTDNAEAITLSDEDKERLAYLNSIRDEKLGEIQDIYSKISLYKKIDLRGVDDIINSFVRGFARGINPIRMLASLKSTDEYTFTHVVNVNILVMSQAESLGFTGRHLYQIGVTSVLHDAGKLFIPGEILNKKGTLTKEERSIMETHTIKGFRYIMGLEGIPKLAMLGAMEHHIKYDGTGYPIIGDTWEPNIVSQMITISDIFDAMRSRRSYKEPKTVDQIIEMFKKERGTTFNPFLLDNFLKLINR